MQKTNGDESAALGWLARRKRERRELKALVALNRDTDWDAARAKIDAAPDRDAAFWAAVTVQSASSGDDE